MVLCLLFASVALAAEPDHRSLATTPSTTENSFGQLPLYFIENQGQLDDEVCYYIQGSDKTLYFTPTGMTIAMISKKEKSETVDCTDAGCSTDLAAAEKNYQRWAMKLDFVDARPIKPKGKNKQGAKFSFFKGKPDQWRTGVSAFSRIVYEDLWPGIDLVYSGTVNRLKYDFVVKPGADPKKIRLAYRGVESVSVNAEETLAVRTQGGAFEDGKPFAYQEIDGHRVEVPMSYSVEKGAKADRFIYDFDIGPFDRTKTLILDPVIIVYCGYIGGDEFEICHDITLDDSGNVYIVGQTHSTELTFPVTVGPDLSFNGFDPYPPGGDAFVAKVNAMGTDLIYCGYVGGDVQDYGVDIALDDSGNAYITGYTSSEENTFPVLVGPDLTFNNPGVSIADVFVAKINSQGTGLDYCGYVGGASEEWATAIDVDGDNRALITGWTRSSESSFPVTVGPFLNFNGDYDAFVAAVHADGTHLDYCGYIGGKESDYGNDIVVNDKGFAFVTGTTNSDESTFPVERGPDLTHNGGSTGAQRLEAWVAKVDKTGSHLDYCGYIGGNRQDEGVGIALGAEGAAYVTGQTRSQRATFPVRVGPDLTHNGDLDTFVAKVQTGGLALDFCGYIGGKGYDFGNTIALDKWENLYVAGRTNSQENFFPVLSGPDLTFNGEEDGYVAKVDASGAHLEYCGYVGGADADRITGIAVSKIGMTYVCGLTGSDEVTEGFPVTIGPDLTFNGEGDGFVAKLALPLIADQLTLSESTGGEIDFFINAGADRHGRDYLLLGGVSGTEPGHPLPGGMVTLPLNLDDYTYFVVLPLLNTQLFSNFLGQLDDHGQAAAQLYSPPLPSGFVGLKLYFAFCLFDPFDFVSNPVEIRIVP
jgi:hypothetical protein